MKKFGLESRTLAKARKGRRKRLESMPPSKERDRLAKRTFEQLNSMKSEISSRAEGRNTLWKKKALDPETNLIRRFKPKRVPKHKKFLKFVTSLL